MKWKEPVTALMAVVLGVSPALAQQQSTVQMKHLSVSNLSISSAVVSWVTDKTTTGNRVEIISPDTTLVFEDSYKSATYIHLVTVTGLAPGNDYKYRIISGGQTWDDGAKLYSITTFGSFDPSPPLPRTVFGKLTDMWDKPIQRALVHLRVRTEGLPASLPKAILTDENGNWTTTWGDFRTDDGAKYEENSGDAVILEFIPNYWSFAADSSHVLPLSSPGSLGTKAINLIDPNTATPGDVDGNGAINIFDLLDLLKIISGKMTPADSRQFVSADLDTSGKINIFDLLVLLGKLKSRSQA